MGPFPLYQYLTGWPVMWAASQGWGLEVVRFWGRCSALAVVGLVWLMTRAGWENGERRGNLAGWVGVAAVLTGPLLAYGASTFNELSAAFWVAAVVAVGASRHRIWGSAGIGLVVLLVAGITKEVAGPFLMLLYTAGLWTRREAMKGHLLKFGAVQIIGIGLAFGINAGVNWVRYGSPWNEHYGAYLAATEMRWMWKAEYLGALLFSPNGGLVWFWPLAVGLLVVTGVWGWRAGKRWVVGAGFLVAAGILGGLASWPSPFGWWCWGPRLAIPWVPALVLLAVKGCPAEVERAGKWLLGGVKRRLSVTVGVMLFSIPQGVALMEGGFIQQFFEQPVPGIRDEMSRGEKQHVRISYESWEKKPWLVVRAVRELRVGGWRYWPVGIMAVGMGGLVWWVGGKLDETKADEE